jgi:hypothetical protein
VACLGKLDVNHIAELFLGVMRDADRAGAAINAYTFVRFCIKQIVRVH